MIQKSCPLLENSQINCEDCAKVSIEWKILELIENLNIAKKISSKNYFPDEMTLEEIKTDLDLSKKYQQCLSEVSQLLTDKEICYVNLLLLGIGGHQEISKKLFLSESVIKSDLSQTIYKYVRRMTGKKITNWAQVRLYLEKQYRTTILNPNQVNIPNQIINIQIQISNPVNQDKLNQLINLLKDMEKI
jgi:hypothetical protein